MVEDVKLISHFAKWLTEVTGHKVNGDTICEDLMDGVALCQVMTMVKGSGVTTYHDISAQAAHLADFKSKENMVQFYNACKKLKLPVQFGTEELVQGNYGKVASTLVFVCHTCASQGVGVKQMDKEIRDRLQSVSDTTANLESIPTGSDEAQLTWWQQLLIRFGLQDWINAFSIDALKAYGEQVKQNVLEMKEQLQAKMAKE